MDEDEEKDILLDTSTAFIERKLRRRDDAVFHCVKCVDQYGEAHTIAVIDAGLSQDFGLRVARALRKALVSGMAGPDYNY